MHLVGIGPSGEPQVRLLLGHGVDPYLAVWERGFELTRTLRAQRGGDGDLTLTVQVRRHRRAGGAPSRRTRGHDRGLRLADGESPVVRQRVAAYAIALSSEGVLGTEFSDRTHVPGQWGLPGGGVDPGEQPPDTVQREIFEEAGQRVDLGLLIDVQSDHWVGRAPSGVLEDFHAVRLVYAADCRHPQPPVVHDVGGTTSDAAWVPFDRWRDWPWTSGAKALLTKHLG